MTSVDGLNSLSNQLTTIQRNVTLAASGLDVDAEVCTLEDGLAPTPQYRQFISDWSNELVGDIAAHFASVTQMVTELAAAAQSSDEAAGDDLQE